MINLWKHMKVNQIEKSFNSKNHILCSNTDIFPIVQNLENKSPLPSFRIIFRFLFSVLSDRVLFRVLSPRFLVCRVPSVASTTWGVLQCFKHFNSNRSFDSFLGKYNAITGNLGKFLKFGLHLRFLTGFWIDLCRVIYMQKYSSRGIPKDSFSERFFKISGKVSWTEYFSKKL